MPFTLHKIAAVQRALRAGRMRHLTVGESTAKSNETFKQNSSSWHLWATSLIDVFSWYVLFSHFRPRDGTLENCVFPKDEKVDLICLYDRISGRCEVTFINTLITQTPYA